MPRKSKRQELSEASMRGDSKADATLYAQMQQAKRAARVQSLLAVVMTATGRECLGRVREALKQKADRDLRFGVTVSISASTMQIVDAICKETGLNRGRALDLLVGGFEGVAGDLELAEMLPELRKYGRVYTVSMDLNKLNTRRPDPDEEGDYGSEPPAGSR